MEKKIYVVIREFDDVIDRTRTTRIVCAYESEEIAQRMANRANKKHGDDIDSPYFSVEEISLKIAH